MYVMYVEKMHHTFQMSFAVRETYTFEEKRILILKFTESIPLL